MVVVVVVFVVVLICDNAMTIAMHTATFIVACVFQELAWSRNVTKKPVNPQLHLGVHTISDKESPQNPQTSCNA